MCRGVLWLSIASFSLLLLGMLVQFLLQAIMLVQFLLRAHTGRSSDRSHRTPLGAAPLLDGFVLGLAFGAEADWCRNVLAAGTCTLKWHGQEYRLEKPEIIPLSQALEAFPRWKRFLLSRAGVKQ